MYTGNLWPSFRGFEHAMKLYEHTVYSRHTLRNDDSSATTRHATECACAVVNHFCLQRLHTCIRTYVACTLVLSARLSQFATHLFPFTLPTQLILKANLVIIFLGTHMYTHVPIRTHVWDCLYIRTHTSLYVHMCGTVCTYVHTRPYTYTCVELPVHTYVHTCPYTYTCVELPVYTYVYTYGL